jgi:hypothetical protein
VPLRSRSTLALALAFASLSGAVAPAAQAAWSAPQTIVGDGAASNVSGAGNRHGSEAFAWTVATTRFVHVHGRSGFASYVRARIRLPDGRLGIVQTISTTGGLVANPQIGVDEAGNVTAVWTQAGRHQSIMAAFRPHGRRFGAPVELGRSQQFNDARPALAVGRFADAVVAWNEGRSVQVVRRAPPLCAPQRARACFSAPVTLRAGTDQAVAIGPLGSAYVVWAAEVHSGADVHTRLRMTVLARSGRRSGSEHFISSTGDAGQPSLAVQRDGTAVIAWRASLPAGGEQNNPAPIMAVTSTPEALSSAPQTVSATPGERPQVQVNAGDEAVLAWQQFNPAPTGLDGPQIAVAVRLAGTTAFGSPGVISPPSVLAEGPSLAVDSAGATYLVYNTASALLGSGVLSHVRAPAGPLGPPVALPPQFTVASVFSAGGGVTAVGAGGGRMLVSDWAP